MQGQRYWVENGKFRENHAERENIGPLDDRVKLNQGQVRITTGDRGTEIKWTVQSPNTGSLFATINWLNQAKAPYVLRFYLSGWFEEFFESVDLATKRIAHIIANCDRHLTCQTMIKQFHIEKAPLSTLLNDCLNDGSEAEAYAIECQYETTSQQYHVKKVGEKSAIGRFYGTQLSSFPCRTAGAYGEAVSSAYEGVINSGRPRYDHILAAMRLPGDEVHWVPYSRLVIPKQQSGQNPAVLVVSELTQIDIRLI